MFGSDERFGREGGVRPIAPTQETRPTSFAAVAVGLSPDSGAHDVIASGDRKSEIRTSRSANADLCPPQAGLSTKTCKKDDQAFGLNHWDGSQCRCWSASLLQIDG